MLSKNILALCVAAASFTLAAQDVTPTIAEILGVTAVEEVYADSVAPQPLDSLPSVTSPMPKVLFMPALYMPYNQDIHPVDLGKRTVTIGSELQWLEAAIQAQQIADFLRQYHAINHPQDVHLNYFSLPEPPKQFVLSADPETATFIFTEVPTIQAAPVEVAPVEVKKQHWLNKFNANIQFSQAYVSPNWYQGGTSSLNMIADFTYQSNLNTKFHPKLLFENFFQWRTALQRTKDDEAGGRGFTLNENRFQINSKFGYKAAHNWYYTLAAVFKTPILLDFNKNGQRTASFLSLGELNVGAGMTYNFTNKQNTFTLGVTISPISYNLKTCINPKVYATNNFGIPDGHKTYSTYGSSTEITWNWKICHAVNYSSRIFAFTNYKYFQGDWQNQFGFTITRWLTANLNVDMRYDTSVSPAGHDWKGWKQFQLRELISLGFTYTFNH